MKDKQKSFTLIELLVVIAIIGLLSAITLVALKGIREKAKLVVILQFSSQVYHALGSDIIGEWNFNEDGDGTCPDNRDFCDSSGNEKHGINRNGVTRADHDKYPLTLIEKAGQFNGTSSYVEIPDSEGFDGMKALTIEGWIKPNSDGYFIVKEGSYSVRYENMEQFSPEKPVFISFRFILEGYTILGLSGLAGLGPGGWYHFTGSISFTESQLEKKVFINGERVYSSILGISSWPEFQKHVNNNDTPLTLGGGNTLLGWYYFDGLLDEVRIYEKALTSAQIKKLYVEGAEKKGLLTKE